MPQPALFPAVVFSWCAGQHCSALVTVSFPECRVSRVPLRCVQVAQGRR